MRAANELPIKHNTATASTVCGYGVMRAGEVGAAQRVRCG